MRSYLAHRRQSSVVSSRTVDVPIASHAGRPARQARKGKDGSSFFARQPSVCQQVDAVRRHELFLVDGMPEGLLVKECEVSVPAVNVLTASCV